MLHSNSDHSVHQFLKLTTGHLWGQNSNNAYQTANTLSARLMIYIYPSEAVIFQALHYFL